MSRLIKAEFVLVVYYLVCSVLIVLEGPRAPISLTVWTLLCAAGSLELAGLAKGVRMILGIINRGAPLSGLRIRTRVNTQQN